MKILNTRRLVSSLVYINKKYRIWILYYTNLSAQLIKEIEHNLALGQGKDTNLDEWIKQYMGG